MKLWSFIRRVWFKFVRTYERLDLQVMSYSEADKLIRRQGEPQDSGHWAIAKEEDTNRAIGYVYLERRRRVLS